MTTTPDLFTPPAPEAAGPIPPVASGGETLPAPALDVWVSGKAWPKGSKTAVRRGGKVIQIEAADYNNAGALTAWSAAVATQLRRTWGSRGPLDETVHVVVEFHRTRPGGTRRWQTYASTKPDVDKLVRAIGDALQTAGVVRDDSRIADLRAIKRLVEPGAEPGVRIRVWALGEWERTGWTVAVPDHPVITRRDGAA